MSEQQQQQPKTKAIILVGGPSLGTRFRPLTLSVPKPLFPIAGSPLIYHHLKACSQLPNLLEVIVLGFFSQNLFSDFIDKSSKELNLNIRYLQEEKQCGTAGGIKEFQKEIMSGLEDDNSHILVVHGDVLCRFPLIELLNEHISQNHFCTILTKKFSSGFNNYGCIVADPLSKEILHYVEKPKTFVNDLVNCGVYAFQSKQMFDQLDNTILSKEESQLKSLYELYKSNDFLSSPTTVQIEEDILKPLAGKQMIYSYQTNDYWTQIKLPASALVASQNLLAERKMKLENCKATIIGNVFISENAIIDDSCVIGPNVSIYSGVRLGPGVRIRNSILLDNVEVRDHSFISNSIIGWNSLISQWVRVEGIMPKDEIKDSTDNYYGAAGYDGITIFAEDVTCKPETCIRSCIVLPHKELSQNYSNSVLL